MSPLCPHARASFAWWDHTALPKPTTTKITALRILFSSLVTEKDVSFEWLEGTNVPTTELKVRVRYPALMNYPSEGCELITDKAGCQVFDETHPVTSAFADAMDSRRDEDGYIYDEFITSFTKEQDPTFVSIPDANVTGFDVLRGKWVNADGDDADFRILQILVREKNLEKNRKGKATSLHCGSVGSKKTKSSNGLFEASPSPRHVETPDKEDREELIIEKRRQLARMQRKHLEELQSKDQELQQLREKATQEVNRLERERREMQERLEREKAELRAQAEAEVLRLNQETQKGEEEKCRLKAEAEAWIHHQAAEISALKQAPSVAPPRVAAIPPVAAVPPVAVVETDSKPRAMDSSSTAALIERAKARMASRTTGFAPAGVSSSSDSDDDSSYMSASDDESYSFRSNESALTSGFFVKEN